MSEPYEDVSCGSNLMHHHLTLKALEILSRVPFKGSAYAFVMKALSGTRSLLARNLPYVGGMLVKKVLMIGSLPAVEGSLPVSVVGVVDCHLLEFVVWRVCPILEADVVQGSFPDLIKHIVRTVFIFSVV